MGQRMADCIRRGATGALVVPMATTPRRRRVRGYNQAHVLAEAVARRKRLPVLDALERPEGRSQVRSDPRERRKNVRDSFRVAPVCRSRIHGREVILIDDVLTTGATALSAAKTLGEAGAETVRLVTFARALPFRLDARSRVLDPKDA